MGYEHVKANFEVQSKKRFCMYKNDGFLKCLQALIRWILNLIMFWVGRNHKDCLVPTSLPWQRHPPLDHAAPSPIQFGLEHFQGGGIRNFSGQHVPVPHSMVC